MEGEDGLKLTKSEVVWAATLFIRVTRSFAESSSSDARKWDEELQFATYTNHDTQKDGTIDKDICSLDADLHSVCHSGSSKMVLSRLNWMQKKNDDWREFLKISVLHL